MKQYAILLVLISSVLATSDFSGVKAGTFHDFSLIFANTTTAYPITDASCRLLLFFPNNSIVFASMPMNHTSDGKYNYTYQVPLTPEGDWVAKANCTSSQENASFSMPFPVRTILYGELVNSTSLGQQLNSSTISNNITQNLISLGFGIQSNNSFANSSAILNNITKNLVSLGVGIQSNSSIYGINSILSSLNTNFSNLQSNVTQIINSVNSSVLVNVTVNVTANNTITNITNTFTSNTDAINVRLDNIQREIDDYFENVLKLLREILATLKHKFIIG